ncbi:RDD family protein [Amycolatopsis cihanbeyliensis]|uniref:RDD family protein n=1 Tax=Amycolatopsis cihanbeyliensis TaxID=1128664 RepID=A0A542DPU4_AMYCI|nr:RDD family protein [Amycolatopsis cihanbeyliensis]TQJ04985.1 RDD family protein [Amycolatopsis cihanbeyliensis]
MARWTGEWLSAPATARQASSAEPPRWPGEHLGLPEDGVGAAAGGGRRLLALLLDLLLASLITALFRRPVLDDPAVMQDFNLLAIGIWVLLTVSPVALFGFTPGMGVCGIRVGRLDGAKFLGLWRALVRAALTFLIVPAAVRNVDARGWHDRLTGTVVVRLR